MTKLTATALVRVHLPDAEFGSSFSMTKVLLRPTLASEGCGGWDGGAAAPFGVPPAAASTGVLAMLKIASSGRGRRGVVKLRRYESAMPEPERAERVMP